eukprot:scaffold97629_cov28-Tisochrysis_lutea.AAC.3
MKLSTQKLSFSRGTISARASLLDFLDEAVGLPAKSLVEQFQTRCTMRLRRDFVNPMRTIASSTPHRYPSGSSGSTQSVTLGGGDHSLADTAPWRHTFRPLSSRASRCRAG